MSSGIDDPSPAPASREACPMATIAADRDLLFGLLALQNGLIDQGQLVAAFQAWTRDKVRPLAEYLVTRGDLDSEQRAGVEAMEALHLKKHHGDAGKSLVALPAGRSTRESLARIDDPDLGRTLAHVASGSTECDDTDRTATYAVGEATSAGQRFRVLRPHARGGLGAVFVALDAELHREVALKQILDSHADDPVSRQRFLTEAEVTGGLEHPGIVPVYGLGTYGDGRPFYAMRFIRGDSLKASIAQFHADGGPNADPGRRSLELRKLLHRLLDVCNAIEYAHSRGVLHRDIKPGNIIVGRYGETLVVDWGLAKATGHAEPSSGERTLLPSSASGSAETLPGSALGTPAYMSPEQARGELGRLGSRSDVYSLGATLYCILAGKPPCQDDDLGRMLALVQEGRYAAPRRLDPSIDRALEAICLKAMALHPEHRHASAQALAEDLERWLADEPVSAWREPLAARAGRWVRRHRTGVVGAAAASLVTVLGLTLGVVLLTAANERERQARRAADLQKAEAQAQRDRAERNFRLAREAVDRYLTRVSEDDRLKAQALEPLRRDLLETARGFYDRFLEQARDDLGLRAERGRAYARLADITEQVGGMAEAVSLNDQARAIFEDLTLELPAEADYQAELAKRLNLAGILAYRTGRKPEAEAAYRRAMEIRQRQIREHSDDTRSLIGLIEAQNNLGLLCDETGRLDEAEAAYQTAIAIFRRLPPGDPEVQKQKYRFSALYHNLGYLNVRRDRHAEAQAALLEAIRLRELWVRDRPGLPDPSNELALSHENLAWAYMVTARHAEAERHYQAALKLRRSLADQHPDIPEIRGNLARCHKNLGHFYQQIGRVPDAEAAYRTAIEIGERLAREHPDVATYRSELANAHYLLGWLEYNLARYQDAEVDYRQALEALRRLSRDHPDFVDYHARLAWTYNDLALVCMRTNRVDEERANDEAALEIRQRLTREHPETPTFTNDLAASHNNLGALHHRAERLEEAKRSYRAALAIREELVHRHPDVARYRHELAGTQANLGLADLDSGRLDEAEGPYRAALANQEILAREHPEIPDYRSDLAKFTNELGRLNRRRGRLDEAESACRAALTIAERLIRERPGDVDDAIVLGEIRIDLGQVELRRGRSEQALERAGAALEGLSDLLRREPKMDEAKRLLAEAAAVRARALDRLGRPREAVATWDRALAAAADRDRPRLQALRAASLARAGDYRQAIATLEREAPGRPASMGLDRAMACAHAQISAAILRSGPSDPSDRQSSAKCHADLAVRALARAIVTGGLQKLEAIEVFASEPDLDPLRTSPDFRLLIMDLAMPAEPFASAP
jgi:serine/threonine-protein kinase